MKYLNVLTIFLLCSSPTLRISDNVRHNNIETCLIARYILVSQLSSRYPIFLLSKNSLLLSFQTLLFCSTILPSRYRPCPASQFTHLQLCYRDLVSLPLVQPFSGEVGVRFWILFSPGDQQRGRSRLKGVVDYLNGVVLTILHV